MSFIYSSDSPTWNSVKGGWYNGNNRAVAVFWKNSDGSYIGKKILENTSETQYPDFSQGATGTLYKTITASDPLIIPKGTYRVVVIGAGGSAGSSAGTADEDNINVIAGTGGSGSSGEMIEEYISLDRGIRAAILLVGRGELGRGRRIPTKDPARRVSGGRAQRFISMEK
jgi:hypothetical protein